MNQQCYRLLTSLLLCGSSFAAIHAAEINHDLPEGFPRVLSVEAMTQGPMHHFFGYYGIYPWNEDQSQLVCLETEFGDRLVEPGEKAHIILIDTKTRKTRRIAETSAWNFQQGAMLHWISQDELIFNDQVEGRLRGVVLNTSTRDRRTLDDPVAAVAQNGRTAISLSFARLRTTRPGYGYAGVEDPYASEPHPKADGLRLIDIPTGKSRLIVSLDQAYQGEPVPTGSDDHAMWFNHVLYNRDDSRIFFMSRIHDANDKRQTAAWTSRPDGTDLRCILPYSWGASHYDWRDASQMVVTTKHGGQRPWIHVLFTDGKEDYEPLATERGEWDGHCHFSPDGKWMVSDTYPDRDRKRSLYLMRMSDRKLVKLISMVEPPEFKGAWRCDLHPRWSRDGKSICIDSTDDGTRQLYVVNLEFP